jgi:hypothetical protein
MQPLLDADVLVYEVGYAAESGWQQPGFPSFDYVAEILDNRITHICAVVEATQPPILYLTGQGNFRTAIAKRTPYKDRPSNKPFHYKNIKAYIKCKYDYRESVGVEADDLLAIEQTARGLETIICTRDKDLKQVPGYFYSWELGNQPSFGPHLIDQFGTIKLSADKKKLSGYGDKFFYAQCLMGDRVDSIPGLDKCGPVAAFNILQATTTSPEAFEAVLGAYRDVYEDTAEAELLEQSRLLHMTRRYENGKVLLWGFPNSNYEEWMDVNTKEITRAPLVLP